MRISDWSSDVCSSDLRAPAAALHGDGGRLGRVGTTDARQPQLRHPGDGHVRVRLRSRCASPPAVSAVQVFAASSTASTWPGTLTLRHMPRTTPASSIRKVDRSIPMYLRPYIDFSTQEPYRSVTSPRSEEHTSELQSLMRISYAVFCLKKKKQ